MLDIDNIPLDDDKTYDTICEGRTFGVFQLESHLGKTWSKRVSPRSIEEISDLISIIRPGCLDSGMADEYVKVKRGEKEAAYIHPDLEEILKPTHGALIYQESCMQIAAKIAGFDLIEADHLRKAIGKKLPAEMKKIKKKFIKGAVKNEYDKELAEEIFSWIEKFGDYGFCASHGCSYAINAYKTAYMKTHHPIEYYTSLLKYSDKAIDPQKEIDDIINDAKLAGIEILPPILSKGNTDFEIEGDNIVFGLKYIKGIGGASLVNLFEIKNCETFNQFIKACLENSINKTTVLGLINSGATRMFKVCRTEQRLLFDLVMFLSKKETGILLEKLNEGDERPIEEIVISDVFTGAMKNRKLKVRNKYEEFIRLPRKDTFKDILGFEKFLLGTTLSGSEADLYNNMRVNSACMETLAMPKDQEVILGAIINEVKEVKTKKGKNPGQLMGFLSISDYSYKLDNVVVFPDPYDKYKDFFYEGNAILLFGKVSKDRAIIATRIEKL